MLAEKDMTVTKKRLFQEPSKLPSVTATDVSRKFNQVIKELKVDQVVEVKKKGISEAVLVDSLFFKEIVKIIDFQNDYIEKLEDMAAVERYKNLSADELKTMPWREAFAEEADDNEFMSMSNEELFGR